MKNYAADMKTAFDPTGAKASHMQFYFGPNHFKTLLASNDLSFKDKDQELEDLVYLGWPIIRLINRWFTINLFDWLSGLGTEHGYGYPAYDHHRQGTGTSYHLEVFHLICQNACPEAYVDKINAKYPKQEDALKKQQETMALYRQYNVSPMGGCLPMLLQTPVFMPSSSSCRTLSSCASRDSYGLMTFQLTTT